MGQQTDIKNNLGSNGDDKRKKEREREREREERERETGEDRRLERNKDTRDGSADRHKEQFR